MYGSMHTIYNTKTYEPPFKPIQYYFINFLTYQVRPDYVKHIWKIINWKDVEERLALAKK